MGSEKSTLIYSGLRTERNPTKKKGIATSTDRRHSAFGGKDPHTALELEALPYQAAQVFEYLCQVASGLSLDDNGDGEELEVFAVHPLCQICQGFGHAIPKLISSRVFPNSVPTGSPNSSATNLKPAGKGMAGLEGPRDKFEGIGQLSLEFFHPLLPLVREVEKRGRCQKDRRKRHGKKVYSHD